MVFLNRGMSFLPRGTYDDLADFDRVPLLATDFDGDGDIDLLAGDALLENRTVPPASEDGNADSIPDGCERTVFHRGDPDGDGAISISDPVYLLRFLYQSGPAPTCREAADTDNDGEVTLTDAIQLLNYLFLRGVAPALPGPVGVPCGPDPDPPFFRGDLGCEFYDSC
jgi:hypothetical protein